MNFSTMDNPAHNDDIKNTYFDSYVIHPHERDKLPALVPFKVFSPVPENPIQAIQIKDIYTPQIPTSLHSSKFPDNLHPQYAITGYSSQLYNPVNSDLPSSQTQPVYSYAPKLGSPHDIQKNSSYDLDDDVNNEGISRTTTPIPYTSNVPVTPKKDSAREKTQSKHLTKKKQGMKSPMTPKSQNKTSPELLTTHSFPPSESNRSPAATRDGANVLPNPSSITNLSLASYQVKESKKYQCKICEKCFTTSGHLARHTRIHTGERKHVCPFEGCESRFARHDNCMQHYRTHLSNGKRKKKSKSSMASTSVH